MVDLRAIAQRLWGNAVRVVRRGISRVVLRAGRSFWIVARVALPLEDVRPPSLPFARETPLGLLELLEVLDRASSDPDVQGVVLRLEGAAAGFAQVLALRRAFLALREAGKPVVVWAEELGTEAFLLASAATRVWLPPAGTLFLVGLRSDGWFLKDLLDQLAVEPDVVRVGDHKSAAEIFTRNAMSPEQREQVENLLDDVYGELVRGIAEGRGLSEEEVRSRIDEGPYGGRAAAEAGLVDSCLYPDQVEEALRELVAGEPPESESPPDGPPPLRRVNAQTYHSLRASDRGWRPLRRDLPRIAYVVGEGMIRRGRGMSGIAADAYRKHLERLCDDPGVQGVILRIDSPGGDGIASDLLWRAVTVVRRKKPVVATMGEVAASGGYYVAAAADAVFAERGTVTGSIGVVGGKVNLEGLYRRVGIVRESVERGARAGLLSEARAFTADERAALRGLMQDLYGTFLDRVAEGRGLPREAVEEVAGGRVWSGLRASRNGLVDRIGGPLEALAEVRKRAGLTPDEPLLLDVHPRIPHWPSLRSLVGLALSLLRR